MINFFTRLRNKVLGINAINQKIIDSQKENLKQIQYHQKELQAIEILKEFYPKNYFPVTGFSLGFQEIQHIINDIAYFNPKIILEFGSGISTIIISNYLKANNSNSIIFSIDNNQGWQEAVKKEIHGNDNTTFFCFPVEDAELTFREEKVKWYQIPSDHFLNSVNEFELVIVDGPYGRISRFARFGFIPFLTGKLAKDAVLFIDDTHRPDELEIAEEASLLFKKNKMRFFDYSRLSNHSDFNSAP